MILIAEEGKVNRMWNIFLFLNIKLMNCTKNSAAGPHMLPKKPVDIIE